MTMLKHFRLLTLFKLEILLISLYIFSVLNQQLTLLKAKNNDKFVTNLNSV